jgi:hypothetical protein
MYYIYQIKLILSSWRTPLPVAHSYPMLYITNVISSILLWVSPAALSLRPRGFNISKFIFNDYNFCLQLNGYGTQNIKCKNDIQ